MNLFQILGTIAIKNQEANAAIDETSDKAKEVFTTIGKTFQDVGNKLSSVGKAIAPVSAVVSGALVASTKFASDFNDKMAKMATLFDTTSLDVSALSKSFLQLSNETVLMQVFNPLF